MLPISVKVLLKSQIPSSSFSESCSSPSSFAWPYGVLSYACMHLNIQTNTQDDPYADFWNSVSAHLSPLCYSVLQTAVTS